MTRQRRLEKKLIRRVIELKDQYHTGEYIAYLLVGDALLARMLQVDRGTISYWRKDGTLPDRFKYPGMKRPAIIYQQSFDQDGNLYGKIGYDLIQVLRLLSYQLLNQYPDEYEQTLNEMQSA